MILLVLTGRTPVRPGEFSVTYVDEAVALRGREDRKLGGRGERLVDGRVPRCRRLLRRGKYMLGHDPMFLPILLRLTPMGTSRRISDQDLVVEGFPRAGNTFVVYALQSASGNRLQVASHVHHPSQVKLAVAGVRYPQSSSSEEPITTLSSYLTYAQHGRPSGVLKEYVSYHQELVPYADRLLVCDFEESTSDMSSVIARINLRYSMEIPPFDQSPANVERIFAKIARQHGILHPKLDPDRVAPRPTATRPKGSATTIGMNCSILATTPCSKKPRTSTTTSPGRLRSRRPPCKGEVGSMTLTPWGRPNQVDVSDSAGGPSAMTPSLPDPRPGQGPLGLQGSERITGFGEPFDITHGARSALRFFPLAPEEDCRTEACRGGLTCGHNHRELRGAGSKWPTQEEHREPHDQGWPGSPDAPCNPVLMRIPVTPARAVATPSSPNSVAPASGWPRMVAMNGRAASRTR